MLARGRILEERLAPQVHLARDSLCSLHERVTTIGSKSSRIVSSTAMDQLPQNETPDNRPDTGRPIRKRGDRWPLYVIALGGLLTIAWIILLMWATVWLVTA